jgi:hypothetical protein
MKLSQAKEMIREDRQRRLEIINEQGTSVGLNNAMKKSCETCNTILLWEDQMEVGPLYEAKNTSKIILCAECFIEFKTEYSVKFEIYDVDRYVRWVKNQRDKSNCRWCESKLDDDYSYCRRCGRE